MSMDFEDFGAPRRNAAECEQTGSVLRTGLGCAVGEALPDISTALENARRNIPEAGDLELVVWPDDRMGEAQAIAHPKSKEISVRESDVENIVRNTHEMRFALMHELVHIVIHSGQGKFFRMSAGNVVYPFLRHDDERGEWQADRIARAILMPPEMVELAGTAAKLALMSGSPLKEAAKRIGELSSGKARKAPAGVAEAKLLIELESATSRAERDRLYSELTKLRLWNALPKIEGEEPSINRDCNGYRIIWDEFGKTSECGWFIENGVIFSFFASRR